MASGRGASSDMLDVRRTVLLALGVAKRELGGVSENGTSFLFALLYAFPSPA